jgi:hypothetical protein
MAKGKVVQIVRVAPPDGRGVVLDQCMAEIERELGKLSRDQWIVVARAVDEFADRVPRVDHDYDW